MEMWGFPMGAEGYGASGALVKMPGFPSGGNSVLVYFSCADCAAEASKVVKAGGSLQKEKMSIGQYGFIALAVDTWPVLRSTCPHCGSQGSWQCSNVRRSA